MIVVRSKVSGEFAFRWSWVEERNVQSLEVLDRLRGVDMEIEKKAS